MSTLIPINPITPAFQQGFNSNVFIVQRFDITVDRMINCNSSPITLLPARAGYFYWPVMGTFLRSGSQFATQPGVIRVRWGASVIISVFTFDNVTLTASDGSGHNCNHSSNFASAGATDLSTAIGSKSILLDVATGNPTVDGSNPGSTTTLLLVYFVIPNIQANVGSY